MKKANFFWIIAAFCIIRMSDLLHEPGLVSNLSDGTIEHTFQFSAEDRVVSGRWMR